MARLRCDFFAETLGLSTTMTVLLPQDVGQEPPTLYLLHGLSDDDTAWTRYTSIERYAAQLGLAVVMPQVHRSFYTDEAQGNRYWTFLSEELPSIVERFFRLSPRREETYVAGLSMGGYGAFKWALRQPRRFAAAASLSGVLDIAARAETAQGEDAEGLKRVFGGDPIAGTPNDLAWLIKQADEVPRLYFCCGTEDFLYQGNLTFLDTCRAQNVAVTTDFGPGEHDWAYWDARIQDVLAWLQVVRR
jgi:putative tributyrin esterase